MKNTAFSNNCSAAAEVIGAILLVLIAVGVFAVLYLRFFPVPLPSPDPHVQLAGYVTDDGKVVIEHVGGQQLDSYEIRVEQSDGAHTYRFENEPWIIGQCYYPPVNDFLFTQEKQVQVSVFDIYTDGSRRMVFDGILTPEDHSPGPSVPPLEDPMSISTLHTNTYDEDIICFSNSVKPNIIPKTFIYNWMVATTGPYMPLTRLLLPFDTQNPFITKDYSGNGNNGTITGATWTNAGKLGGAYQYDGNDFIAIPYCFQNNKIDTITVEAWVKTTALSGTILSYNRNNYYELAVSDGHVKWSTNGSDGTIDMIGTRTINDNVWHLISVTYNSSTGDGCIYMDGKLDLYQHIHTLGSQIGSGNRPSGAVGTGTGVVGRQTIFSTGFETQVEKDQWAEHNTTSGSQTWTNLKNDNFNAGWGSYTPGSNGSSADAYRSSSYRHEGTYSACIRDNSGWASSFYLTNSLDVDTPAYKTLKIDFWWMWRGSGWSNGEDWWLMYYNGTTWNTIFDIVYPGSYSKDTWYHKIVYLNESAYRFPTAMRLRFQCDASYDDDTVYIDQIYINATNYGRIECDFNRLPSTVVTPHTGSFSLGGSGDFDPEYAAFNRTAITITNYSSVQISLWYSYKNTISSDFLGLYYKNNSLWSPIFEKTNPSMVGAQSPWVHVVFSVPKSVTTLVLQFKWRTSAANEYVAMDDLEISGIPHGGESNFSGLIDEVKIYDRVLSPEQLYQNYLCTKDGNSSRSVIVSEELHLNDFWKCLVTPNDGMQDDVITQSNLLYIINYSGGG